METFAKGLLGAAIGTAIVLLTWHVWTDHRLHHEMLRVLQANAAAQQQQAAPPATSPTP